MKKLILILFAVFGLSLIFISSCKKDKCQGVSCLNGGTCNDGTCNCPPGYSGSRCETHDPCYGVTCLNGGYCANGSCVCPSGYTGSNCSQQVTPTKITITKIEVTKFPLQDGSGDWDTGIDGPGGGLPDIYPELYLSSALVWSSPTYTQDATTPTYTFTPNPYIEMSSPTSQYTIRLMDYDNYTSDDWMGGINFTPYSSSNGFPSTLTVDAGGNVAFKLYVTYTW